MLPTSKPKNHPVIGVETLSKIVALSPHPVVAIGGINRLNVAQVLQTGVAAIALISALTGAQNIQVETRCFAYFDCE